MRQDGGERLGPHRILACAREAGGAAAIAPVLLELQRQASVLVLAKDYAESVFRDHGLVPVRIPGYSNAMVHRLLTDHMGGESPEVVITSTASLPQLDMTERYLWNWAKRQRIPSVAVLDQWQYYELRFSGPSPAKRLAYLPDWVTAMDESAKRGLVEAGVPEGCIVVTGQPAFDRLPRLRQTYRAAERSAFRKMIGASSDARLLCFVAEAFAEVFRDRLGYTEQTTLREFMAVCQRLVVDRGLSLHVAIKFHPRNDPKEFTWLKSLRLPKQLRVTLHGKEHAPLPLVMASDVVVGMTSILLVESILLGRPTVSFQPSARRPNGLMATVVGAIPLLDDAQACFSTVSALLQDRQFLDAYLDRQARLTTDGQATARVVELVQRVKDATGAIPLGVQ